MVHHSIVQGCMGCNHWKYL